MCLWAIDRRPATDDRVERPRKDRLLRQSVALIAVRRKQVDEFDGRASLHAKLTLAQQRLEPEKSAAPQSTIHVDSGSAGLQFWRLTVPESRQHTCEAAV